MGMYSYTEYCDLKIRDGKKEEFLKWLENHQDYKEIVEIFDDDSVYIEINGWKIIGYWYEDFLKELRELNEFLVGEWCLIYETHEEMAIIQFGDDGVKIKLGEMVFTEYPIEFFEKMNEDFGKMVW
jgi:hypothetical protein